MGGALRRLQERPDVARALTQYRFLSTWVLDAPIGAVWEILHDADSWPQWWPGVLEVSTVEAGDERGIGALRRTRWRSRLPYELAFDFRITESEPPHLLSGEASGELEGEGRWRLFEGRGTACVYEWSVRTTRPWMNAIAPLAHPLFALNHDWIMRRGGAGLARRLGVALLASD